MFSPYGYNSQPTEPSHMPWGPGAPAQAVGQAVVQ